MKELLNTIKKDVTAWDFYVPSLTDLLFIEELENGLKFNLDVNIEEVNEQYTHGIIHYDEVKLSCYRATGDTSIQQGENTILLEHDQAVQLYQHLKSVFGE